MIESQNSRLLRLILLFGAVLLVACICFIAYSVIQSLEQPQYFKIVDKLPNSARLVRHELIWHGIDSCQLFEYSCSDTALRDLLISKWRLHDLTEGKGDMVSFVQNDHPKWWTPDTPPASHKYGRCDRNTESYMSVWEQSKTGRLYVEVGRW